MEIEFGHKQDSLSQRVLQLQVQLKMEKNNYEFLLKQERAAGKLVCSLNEDLERRFDALETKYGTLKNEKSALFCEKEDLQDQLDEKTTENEQLKAALSTKDAEIAHLKAELEALKNQKK